MTGIIIILGIYIAAYVAINRRYSVPEQADTELTERLRRINQLNEQIEAVNELITDIGLTSGDVMKCVSINWETAAGHELTVSIWLDGESESTKAMMSLAQARLNELTGQLYDEIGKLPYRRRQNALRKAKSPVDKRLTAGGGGQNA